MGKGHRDSMPSPGMPLSLNLQVFTNLELSNLFLQALMEASLYRHD